MRQGFTLLETTIATSVMALVVVAAMGSWLLFMHKSNRTNQQAMLDLDVRNVVERFRTEMRNAARETIIFYPEKASPYQAVGFALASDSDGDGLMDMDASGSNILWRQTVVYHVYDRSPTQMRRTVFSNRNSGASYGDYYDQVGTVVSDGNGANACLPGEAARTYIMFENLFTGRLWHAESVFDGYAASPNTLERITFGSLALGPGEHQVTFTTQGRNPASSGSRVRIDQLSASVSAWPLEAELRTCSGTPSSPTFVGIGLAGGAYGLDTPAMGDGETVSLTVYNDAIEECGFIGKGRNVALSNTVVRFDPLYRPAGFASGVYQTSLEGQYAVTWQGGDQTGDGARSEYYYPTNCIMRIPVLAPYVMRDGFGPVFRFYKSLYNAGLRLTKPAFSVLDAASGFTGTTPDIPPNSQIPLVFYQDGVEKPDWDSCTSQKYVELRPRQSERIYQGNAFMVSFMVSVASYGSDRFTAFDVKRSGMTGCWYIPGAHTNLLGASWAANPAVVATGKLPTLEAIAVGFADGGDYVSHPFDTRSSKGAAKSMVWDADIPSGASLLLYARSGNTLSADGFGIDDAPQWESLGALARGGTVPGAGRYLQFRAVYTSSPFSAFPGTSGGIASGPYRTATPRLRQVLITWDGEAKYVDVMANLLKGPDCGKFKVEVDGKPLVRGVTMEIEIFKDVLTQGGVKKERMRSAMMAEVEPRNSGKK
jgi:type II secretory pathway pseudopilin PulG